MAQSDIPPKASTAELVARFALWPGDAAARALGITSPDSRMLFRLFVNLAVYGKLGVLIALLVL